MRLVFLAIACVGCLDVREPDCVTTCGLYVFDSRPGECDELQKVEDASRRAFERHVDGWTAGYVCEHVARTAVYLTDGDGKAPQGSWVDRWSNVRVLGLAACDWGGIWVGRRDTPWSESSLTHELAHVVEDCADPLHTTWQGRGIQAAIDE